MAGHPGRSMGMAGRWPTLLALVAMMVAIQMQTVHAGPRSILQQAVQGPECKFQHAAFGSPSFWECYGSSGLRRSCLFSNMFYNTVNDTFYVHVTDPALVDLVHQEASLLPLYNVTATLAPPPT